MRVMLCFCILPTLVRAGLRRDAAQGYTAEEVNASALEWNLKTAASNSAAHKQAQEDCMQRDSSVVRANKDSKSYLASGAWCLPEGKNTSSLVELPNGQTYMIPRVHAKADASIVPFLDRLLRGCSPEDAAGHQAKCNQPPRYSIIDIGAGVGQYGHSLRAIDPAHDYRGYDGAGNVERVTSGFVRWTDMTSPRLALPKADWVMSLEVGEHIDSKYERHFARNLHTHNCRGLVISWAVLGQWGRGHVNNHGEGYIKRVFAELGYVYDVVATTALREQHIRTGRTTQVAPAPGVSGPYWWFAKSLFIFRRATPQTGPGCGDRSLPVQV